MKIRLGYVTNSSSTNFLIMSKQELTVDYLYKKLGFEKASLIKSQAEELCENIIYGTVRGLRWFDIDEINEESVRDVFGEKAARIYREKDPKGFFTYMGHTDSDDSKLTYFFTIDSFEIEEKDFYLNARNCVW